MNSNSGSISDQMQQVLNEELLDISNGDVKPIDISEDLPRHPVRTYSKRKLSKIKRVVLHTTDWTVTPEELAKYDITPYFIVNGKKVYNHISKEGCPAITYHEMYMKNGTVYKTLPYEEISWHAGNWNGGSIGVAMVYKAVRNTKNGKVHLTPPDKLIKVAQTRCGDLCLEFNLTPDKVVGHRELKGTGWFWAKGSKKLRKSCPGKKIDMDLVRYNVAKYMQIKLFMAKLYKGKIDGIFGPKSITALGEWNA